MLEKEMDSQVRSLAKQWGLMAYHTHDSRKSGKGWPDWVVQTAWGHVMFAELKGGTTVVTDEQYEWIRSLKGSGALAFIVRGQETLNLFLALMIGHDEGTIAELENLTEQELDWKFERMAKKGVIKNERSRI